MSFLLSICIPTYNRKDRVVKTVQNLMSTDIENLEVSVLDNGSEDGTYEALCKIQDRRFRLIRNETNIGQFQNHYKALFTGTGKYIVVMMDRDEIEIDNLRVLLKYLSRSKYDAVLTNPYFVKKRMILNKKNSCYPWTIGSHPSYIVLKRDILVRDWTYEKLCRATLSDVEYVLPWAALILTESYWDKHVLFIPELSWVRESDQGTTPYYSGRRTGYQLYYMPQAGLIRMKVYCSLENDNNIGKKDRYTRNLAIYASELLRSTILVYVHTRPGSHMKLRYGFRHVKKQEYYDINRDLCIFMLRDGIKNKVFSLGYYYKVIFLALMNRIRIEIMVNHKMEFLRNTVIKLWEKSYCEIFLR